MNKAKLIQGDVKTTLIRLTIPMILGIVGMFAFNLIDTYFIGKLGKVELAAISFTFPVVLFVSSIALGLSVGASSVISQLIGTGNIAKVKRTATDALLLSVIIVLILVIIGFLIIDPLFTMLGAKYDTFPLIKEYMTIWYLGMPFVVIPMVGNGCIRATGDTKTPGIIMLISIAINIILDPILIFGFASIPAMGIKGAAIGTLISRLITFICAFLILYKREKMIIFKKVSISELFISWRKILFIGIPAAATNLIMPLTIGIITSLVATYGNSAVAGFGAASRIEAFSVSIIIALSSILVPFIGQNMGAKKTERIQEAISLSNKFSIFWGIITFTTFYFFSENVGKLFNKDPEVITIIAIYLVILSISHPAQGFIMITSSGFNAMHKPYNAMALNALKMFILYIPFAYLGSFLYGLNGIFIAATIATIISGLTAYFWMKYYIKKA